VFNPIASLLTKIARFGRDQRGTTPVFLGAIVPAVACVGFAVDYGNIVSTQSRLQATIDSAVMAGMTEQIKNVDPIVGINSYISSQGAKFEVTPQVSIIKDAESGKLTVTGTVERTNAFMQVLGFATSKLTASAVAEAGAGGTKFEVAIAFDTTGSMAGQKLAAAKEAATQLVDQLYKVPGSDVDNPNVRIGLVPFAHYVNVGLQYRGASWLTDATDYTTPGRWEWDDYPDAVYGPRVDYTYTCWNDGIPSTCTWSDRPVISYGQPVHRIVDYTNYFTWYGCVGSQGQDYDALDGATSDNKVPALLNYYCPSPLIRLTNDKASVKTAISSMSAGGETYIPPGLLWGWRLLSPNAASPFADGAPYGEAKKILILLTDGANTHSANYASGDHGPWDVAAANAKVIETCKNIKTAGVEVYTILFSETDPTIQDVLTKCSSGPPYHYSANTIADLQGVFTTIGQQLAGIRIVR
jgi:Mg-chelatase subunit ChlD